MPGIDPAGLPAAIIRYLVPAALIAYFCGCFNGSVIVSKYILRDDVRNHGSGNAGLTNFYRTFGGPLTFVVILCDVLKAVVAIQAGRFIIADVPAATYWAALFCLLGHMFPCMFHFKGGKGILSGGTIAFMIDWRLALIVWSAFLLAVVLTRYVSLGSCCAALAFPVATWFLISHDPAVMILSVIICCMILFMHRGNIRRLLSGTENRFSFHKK